MNKLIESMLNSLLTKQGGKGASVLLMNGSIMLYMLSGYLLTEKEYLLAVVCAVIGSGLVELRERAKPLAPKHKK